MSYHFRDDAFASVPGAVIREATAALLRLEGQLLSREEALERRIELLREQYGRRLRAQWVDDELRQRFRDLRATHLREIDAAREGIQSELDALILEAREIARTQEREFLQEAGIDPDQLRALRGELKAEIEAAFHDLLGPASALPDEPDP